MPKESPPGPDFSLKELEKLAWAEARRSQGLVPNGGRWWTSEDIAFAVAILDEETRSRAFRRAWDAGMTSAQVRRWLSKALHNGLVKYAARTRRLKLLDDRALDQMCAPRGRRGHLDGDDAATLARQLRGRLSAEEAGEIVRRCVGAGIGSSIASRAWTGPSRATRARTWSRVLLHLDRLAREAGLNRAEAGEVLRALAVKLTGGGAAGGKFRESVRPFGIVED